MVHQLISSTGLPPLLLLAEKFCLLKLFLLFFCPVCFSRFLSVLIFFPKFLHFANSFFDNIGKDCDKHLLTLFSYLYSLLEQHPFSFDYEKGHFDLILCFHSSFPQILVSFWRQDCTFQVTLSSSYNLIILYAYFFVD